MLGSSPSQCFCYFTLSDLAVNNFKRVDLDPNLTSIIHHDMEMRWCMVFEIDTKHAFVEALYDWHLYEKHSFNSAIIAL